MKTSFWKQRWQENKIGFHLNEVNPLLIQYADTLRLAPGQQVFVPLSGKSLDIIWLAQQGYQVLANELSPLAVEAFFAENHLQPSQIQKGDLSFYQSGLITFVCGDFFKLTPTQMINVAAVYDRAALVALPEAMRIDYSRHLNLLCPRQSRLLVTLEYEQSEMAGPPFAVQEDELRAEYANGFQLRCLQRSDVLAEHAHFAAKGLSGLDEAVYILHPQ